jgi:hypothetical protein
MGKDANLRLVLLDLAENHIRRAQVGGNRREIPAVARAPKYGRISDDGKTLRRGGGLV